MLKLQIDIGSKITNIHQYVLGQANIVLNDLVYIHVFVFLITCNDKDQKKLITSQKQRVVTYFSHCMPWIINLLSFPLYLILQSLLLCLYRGTSKKIHISLTLKGCKSTNFMPFCHWAYGRYMYTDCWFPIQNISQTIQAKEQCNFW